jgi:hypothetical protein
MRPIFAALAAAVFVGSGCGRSENDELSADSKVPSVIRETDLSAPLMDDEVRAFLDLLPKLPDGAAPAFQPAGIRDTPKGFSAIELTLQWQRDFRSAYRPQTQARLWHEENRLIDALEVAGVEPSALASLMVRLSSAVAREALDDSIDLSLKRKEADRLVKSLCTQIDEFSDPSSSPDIGQEGPARAELLADLREAVAFREFVNLLQQVPEESLAVVHKHREALRKHLPTGDAVAAFARWSKRKSGILPAGYETRAK